MSGRNNKKLMGIRAIALSIGIAAMAGSALADQNKHHGQAIKKVKGDLSVMVLGSGGPLEK